jgi:hypothetical protein
MKLERIVRMDRMFIFFLITALCIALDARSNMRIKTTQNLNILNTAGGYDAEVLLQAIRAQQQASQAATVAVNAFAQAVSTCRATVSCDLAKTQVITAKSYQQTASSASAQTQQAMSDASKAADKIRLMLSQVRNSNSSLSDLEHSAKAAQMAQEATNMSNSQAQLAVQATATAVSSCELIVNVVCNNPCSNGSASSVSPPINLPTPDRTFTLNTAGNILNTNNNTNNSLGLNSVNATGSSDRFIGDAWRRLSATS